MSRFDALIMELMERYALDRRVATEWEWVRAWLTVEERRRREAEYGPMVRWLDEQLGTRLHGLRGPATGWTHAVGTRVRYQFVIYDTEMRMGTEQGGVVTALEQVDPVDRQPRYRVALDDGRERVARTVEVTP